MARRGRRRRNSAGRARRAAASTTRGAPPVRGEWRCDGEMKEAYHDAGYRHSSMVYSCTHHDAIAVAVLIGDGGGVGVHAELDVQGEQG
jgi:hypothetical protein